MKGRDRPGFILVSPCLCANNYGGVQLSGRIVRDRLTRELGNKEFRCLCYGMAGRSHSDPGCVTSKLTAAFKAATLRDLAGTLLFWHVGLLKLLPILRRRDSRTYLFLHGIECWSPLGSMTQYLLGSVDTFLVNSSFTWNRFLESNPRWTQSAHQIVRLGTGTPDSGEEIPGPVPAAVIVGRMQRGEEYKGHKELIRAWPQVLSRMASAELWIVGGGDLESELKRQVHASNLESRIRFFGMVSDQEKERLIRNARCLALPSRGEGFGLVYLEAMRSGRPCLSSTIDAGREVINPPETGLSVDPDDPVAISDAVVRLLTPGAEWERWSADARRRYQSEFTAKRFEDRMLLALGKA
jgi:phosphatidylinositol alpha-1,6-mannosyltransferase